MAYRRSITSRSKVFYQQGYQLLCPSFHLQRDGSDQEESRRNPISKSPETCGYHHRGISGTGRVNSSGFTPRARSIFQDRGIGYPLGYGLLGHRNFSTASVGEGSAGNIAVLKDVVDVLGDKGSAVAGQAAPVVNEVAVSAADSYFPVAALQHLIDYVHVSAGLDWWAAIALTTLAIRLIQLPVSIHLLRVTSKLNVMREDMEKLQEEWDDKGLDMFQRQAQLKALYKQHGVTPFAPFKGILISGPIFCSFFFAIRTMSEKVPSFKDGGALWFTDLTTPDSTYIFPVLTALTFLLTVELNAQEGLEGNPASGPVKMISRVFAFLTVPLTLSFPKAIFCYWIPSNLFSFVYGFAAKQPKFKEFFGIPIAPVTPPSSTRRPALSFFDAVKKYMAEQSKSALPPAGAEARNREAAVQGTPVAESSTLSHRIKSLEKEVKARKKGKKHTAKRK